jgi:hypothetical protein
MSILGEEEDEEKGKGVGPRRTPAGRRDHIKWLELCNAMHHY